MIFNTRRRSVIVTSLVLFLPLTTHQAAKAGEIPRACNLEYPENETPMDGQPSNGNPCDECDECDEWLVFLTQDKPCGELETNGGDSGSVDKSRDTCQFIPETESKCVAISITCEIWV